ncbi:hypothetical protein C8J56DRAFT_1057519 [Mycena floridula]|nr:hypothetical protein C8J56DRAFT_1057519 [Mycena floridula]
MKHNKQLQEYLETLQPRKRLRTRRSLLPQGNISQYVSHPSSPVMNVASPLDEMMDIDMDMEQNQPAVEGPKLPELYIKFVFHPHSSEPGCIISLSGSEPLLSKVSYNPELDTKPWAPFRSLEDFEYMETAIQSLLSKSMVDIQLASIHGHWSKSGSTLTLKNHKDMEKSLAAARQYTIQFKTTSVTASYKGKKYEHHFEYCDPWEVIVSLTTDHTLAKHCEWYSAQKILCHGGLVEEELDQLYDEPFTAHTWWDVDSSLPDRDRDTYEHCYMPVHIWLDKGNVTTKVKAHPMLLRALFLEGKIRNASGNGGGVLLVYMPIVTDPGDSGDRIGRAKETLEFQQYKKETLKIRSRNGNVLKFGDGKIQVGHPGIAVELMDGEEIAHWTGIRAATADHPCPKCLVKKCDLHRLSLVSELRTTRVMRAAFIRASIAPTAAKKEEILQDFGMHDIDHFLWDFEHSDPYQAVSYDVLHFDDTGKWGKHLWPLLLEVLRELRVASDFNDNMHQFPRWSKLKHFKSVSNIDYSDGQTFFDILKCCLPCLVQILLKNSPLIHCIRAFQRYRMVVGLHCHSDKRLELLKNDIIPAYEKCCETVSRRYGKNFDFFKQHLTLHVMSIMDEKQEAIACIWLTIDKSFEAQKRLQEEFLEDGSDENVPKAGQRDSEGCHWTFKAPQKVTDSKKIENENTGDPVFKDFDFKLHSFVLEYFPHLSATYEQIYPFHAVELCYQSLDDWTEARDILRCTPLFSNTPQFDSVVLNTEPGGMRTGRLVSIFRCRFMNTGETLELALVHKHMPHRWKPRTVWQGCQVVSEEKSTSLILMQYIVRGALLSPAFGANNSSLHYIVDCADYNMFLHANGH